MVVGTRLRVGGRLRRPVARRARPEEERRAPCTLTDARAALAAPRLTIVIECRCCRSPLNVSRRPPPAAPGRRVIECRCELSRASISASIGASIAGASAAAAPAAATSAPPASPPASACVLCSGTPPATELKGRDAAAASAASSAASASASGREH